MELRRLRLLDALARLGTVAAVADALSFSASSVSVQLAQLEREAGVALLRRVGRNVELTPAGRRLATYAADALTADETIRAEIAAADDAPGGRLRMTIVQTPALALLPATLDRLATTAPNLEVEVVQQETAPALDNLRARTVDLVVGIEYDPVPVARQRDIDRRDLLREDVLLALHPGHPLAADRAVGLAACEHQAWATGHRGTGLDAVLRNICNRLADFEPTIRHRSDDGLVLGALVASGRAVALLPELLTTVLPQITTRQLIEERLQRTIFTAARAAAATAPGIIAVRSALQAAAATPGRDTINGTS
ncbi:LysR family transcriptional regulator [Dactylosporangium siamense]|uniref:LysR family transcriptional regulator n=1 Tax=Dactylosporangium siamense TaxID=685454 RepID=A0A919UIG1_9ACTN|nr:LysR substrate-binding domain-containing protein [Dactylosporangium siamense]GIG52600.1 LysR family transcriptional regulator [Dactylosporangium siamense]